jgi:hypothetical protein
MLKAIAIALMFWCAGTGCLMVSYARGMSEPDSSAAAAEESMKGMHASMDAHACCKAKHKNTKRAKAVESPRDLQFTQFGLPAPLQNNAMSCCPLTTGSIVIATRSQSNDSASASAVTDSSSFKLTSLETRPLAVPLRLPNRVHAYLLDCAFLI